MVQKEKEILKKASDKQDELDEKLQKALSDLEIEEQRVVIDQRAWDNMLRLLEAEKQKLRDKDCYLEDQLRQVKELREDIEKREERLVHEK